MSNNYKDFSESALASGITSGATSLSVTTGHGIKFPSPPFKAVIWNKTDYARPSLDPSVEKILVTSRTGDVFSSITRGIDGSSAAAHNATGKIYGILHTILSADLQDALATRTFSGAGVPGVGVGTNGDFYINETNGDHYKKNGGAWSLIGNIRGPAGPAGAGYYATASDTFAMPPLGGSVSVTTQTGLAYTVGSRVRFADSTYPELYFFEGTVNTYVSGTGVLGLEVDLVSDSGPALRGPWTINLAGAQGSGYRTVSNTNTIVSTGTKVFSVFRGLAYLPGARVRVSRSSTPSTYLEGVVTDYTGGTLTVDVDVVSGSGVYGSWNINVAGEPGTGTGGSGAIKVDSINDLEILNVAGIDDFSIVEVLGYWEPGDGGGGSFFYNSSDTRPANGVTIYSATGGGGRWTRRMDGDILNVKWAGAIGDNVTNPIGSTRAAKFNSYASANGWYASMFTGTDENDYAAIQLVSWLAGINRYTATDGGRNQCRVYIPVGRYMINREIWATPQDASGVSIQQFSAPYFQGDGWNGTILRATSAMFNKAMFRLDGHYQTHFKDIQLEGPGRVNYHAVQNSLGHTPFETLEVSDAYNAQNTVGINHPSGNSGLQLENVTVQSFFVGLDLGRPQLNFNGSFVTWGGNGDDVAFDHTLIIGCHIGVRGREPNVLITSAKDSAIWGHTIAGFYSQSSPSVNTTMSWNLSNFYFGTSIQPSVQQTGVVTGVSGNNITVSLNDRTVNTYLGITGSARKMQPVFDMDCIIEGNGSYGLSGGSFQTPFSTPLTKVLTGTTISGGSTTITVQDFNTVTVGAKVVFGWFGAGLRYTRFNASMCRWEANPQSFFEANSPDIAIAAICSGNAEHLVSNGQITHNMQPVRGTFTSDNWWLKNIPVWVLPSGGSWQASLTSTETLYQCVTPIIQANGGSQIWFKSNNDRYFADPLIRSGYGGPTGGFHTSCVIENSTVNNVFGFRLDEFGQSIPGQVLRRPYRVSYSDLGPTWEQPVFSHNTPTAVYGGGIWIPGYFGGATDYLRQNNPMDGNWARIEGALYMSGTTIPFTAAGNSGSNKIRFTFDNTTNGGELGFTLYSALKIAGAGSGGSDLYAVVIALEIISKTGSNFVVDAWLGRNLGTTVTGAAITHVAPNWGYRQFNGQYTISGGAPTFNAEFVGQEAMDVWTSPYTPYKAVKVGTGAGDWQRVGSSTTPLLNDSGSGVSLVATPSTSQVKKLLAGTNVSITDAGDHLTLASTGGDFTGASSNSEDGNVVKFSGTTGKIGKDTGVAKIQSVAAGGVRQAALINSEDANKYMLLGAVTGDNPAIWARGAASSPSDSNYAIQLGSADVFVNASSSVNLRVGNDTMLRVVNGSVNTPTNKNFSVGGDGSFGGGAGVFFLTAAGTVPTSNPTGGVILWWDGTNLKARKPDGSVVTIF